MASTVTPVLGLNLPTPGTKEPFNTVVVNANWSAIDSAIGQKASKFTTTTVGNTVTDTTVFSFNIPGGSPQGSVHTLRVWGTYDNAASATNFTIRAKIGGTQITAVTVGTPAGAQTFSGWEAEIEVVVATTGAAGTWRGKLTGTKSDSASGTGPLLAVPGGTGTVKDTTVAQLLEITVQWAVANAANVVRADAGVYTRKTNA